MARRRPCSRRRSSPIRSHCWHPFRGALLAIAREVQRSAMHLALQLAEQRAHGFEARHTLGEAGIEAIDDLLRFAMDLGFVDRPESAVLENHIAADDYRVDRAAELAMHDLSRELIPRRHEEAAGVQDGEIGVMACFESADRLAQRCAAAAPAHFQRFTRLYPVFLFVAGAMGDRSTLNGLEHVLAIGTAGAVAAQGD